MRFIIYGAGAVGGVIGARLHQAGREVVLIARGLHQRTIRDRGLTLKTPDEQVTLAIDAVAHPREISFRSDDAVLLCMKTQDTAAALEDLRGATSQDLPIVCAQNGVENERIAARSFSGVYGMYVWLPATFLKPGEVVCYAAPAGGILDVGCYPQGSDALIEEVAAGLREAGFGARAEPRIMRWKYGKLLANVRNAIVATLGHGVAAGDFGERVRAEARACYEAAGIDWTSAKEEAARRDELGVEVRPVDGQPPLLGSSWQSLERGLGSIETDFLNGEIVLLGHLWGVPTPCNRGLQIAATRMARNGQKSGALSLDELEQLARGSG